MTFSKPQPPESLIDILHVLWKWRKYILLFTLAGTVVTAIGSFMLPDYYKSTTKFYAANDEAYSRGALYGQGQSTSDIGNEEMAERIINYAQSRDLTAYMVQKFDLYKHYDIDSTSPRGQDKVFKKFESLYKVTKDEYGAVVMSIEDKDKSLPLPMVQAAVKRVDELYQQAIKTNRQRTLDAYLGTITERQNRLNTISDTLQKLRFRYGIFDVYNQGQVLSELVLKTESELAQNQAGLEALKRSPLIKADTIVLLESRVVGLQKKLESLMSTAPGRSKFSVETYNEGRNQVKSFEDMETNINMEMRELTEKYSQFKTTVALTPSVIVPAEMPQAPKIKSRPKRSILILGGVLVSLIVSMMSALLFQTYSNINWKEVFNK